MTIFTLGKDNCIITGKTADGNQKVSNGSKV